MSAKSIGLGLLVIGIIVIVVFLLADVFGIGRDPTVIGSVQLLGAAVGLVLVLVGWWFGFLRGKSKQ